MPLPRWLARFNIHVTNRVLGPVARYMPSMGVLLHVGRKTRQPYRTPVNVFRRGDKFIIVLTYGRGSQWVQNVLANGGAEMETHGRTVRLSQPRLFHDEHQSVVPALVRPILKILSVTDFLEVRMEDKQ